MEVRIDQGESVPLSWYRDPAIYEREQQRVFGDSWQYLGPVDRLPAPGSFFTASLGRIPVVAARDADGEIRAFANVCPHRGHAIADGEGCRRTLQCRYPGWTFDLDGALRTAPRTKDDPTFDAQNVRLKEFAVARWGPLLFANPTPDPSTSFDEATAGLRGAAAERGFNPVGYPYRASRSWSIECNWKITLDNNTECYHCATIHPSFASDYHVDNDHYLVRGFDQAFTHESAMRQSDNDGTAPDFHLYYLWPNFMLSARRTEYFYTYHYRPAGPTSTVQVNDYFFPAEWSDVRVDEAIDDIAVIMREDWGAFESVQRGINSEVFAHGVVLPHEEQLLCHFQRMYADALSER
jgi:choline monooxygenase